MIRTLSKPRSKSNLINIHMKFILLVIIGALLWNSNEARQFTSDSLQSMSDFIEPNQQREIKLSFWFMTTMTDNISLKDELIDRYVTRVIDGLDLDDCLAILHDYMTKSYEDYSLEEMKEEVEEYYPELLD